MQLFDILENLPISIRHQPRINHTRKSRLNSFLRYHHRWRLSGDLNCLSSTSLSPSPHPLLQLPPSNHPLSSINRTSKMDRRPSITEKAASTNRLPTRYTPAPRERSASCSASQDAHRQRYGDYDYKLRTASTELMNDHRVGLGSKAGRTLQNVLMDTEHHLREQKREELHKLGGHK